MIELIGNKIFLDDNYEIREYETDEGIVRALVSNGCIESLLYVDSKKRNELAIDYFEYYDLPISLNQSGSDYLMLGGGGFSYPHYYLNKYKNKRIDVVEINEKCIEYAKKYFYLDELIESNKDRLNIILEDAINYILCSNKKYDYILIDLFNGSEPIKNIYDKENIINLKNVLKENGIIVINYIINNNKDNEKINEIIKITNNYKIITNQKYFNNISTLGNIIIILSNSEINISNNYKYIDVSKIIK